MSQPPNPPSAATPQQPGELPPPGGDWQSDPTRALPAQQYPAQQYPPTRPMPAQPPVGGSGSTGEPYAPGGHRFAQDPAGGPVYGEPSGGGYGQGSGGQRFVQGPTSGAPGGPGQPFGQGQPYGQGGQAFGQGGPPFGQGGQPYGQGGPPLGQGGQPHGQGGPPYGQPVPGGPLYGPGGGQFGPSGGAGGYGPPGQYPPGGVPGGPPPPSGGRGNQLPLVIAIVAGVLVVGLLAWFLFLRPTGTAAPSPSRSASARPTVSATPSESLSPSAVPSVNPSQIGIPSGRPSGTRAAACSPQLSDNQCGWAVYLDDYVDVASCQLAASDPARSAFSCVANRRGKLKGDVRVTMRWADDSKDLTHLVDDFFVRAGISKSRIGRNWKNPPARTDWWYSKTPKKVEGKLVSADAKDGTARVAWTYASKRFYAEAVSDGDSARAMIDWWAR